MSCIIPSMMLSLSSDNTEHPPSLVRFAAALRSVSSAFSAWGSGSTTLKRLPVFRMFSTDMLPSISSARLFTIDSPSPKPSCVAALLSRSNGLNICSRLSLSIPPPVSSTASVNFPPAYRAVSVTPPRSVNFSAFDSRLLPIRSIRFLSPMTTSSAALFTLNSSRFSSIRAANSVSSVSATPASLNGFTLTVSFPLSMR